MSNTFTEVFGGTTIYPSDVSYLAVALSSNITLDWPLENAGGANLVARIMDVTPTGVYSIAMPDATQTGVGQTVLFNNLGPYAVTVTNSGGTPLLTLSAGTQWQLYLVDNTSISGIWRTFQYGATTAQAQSAALAGYGLVAIGSTLAQSSSVSTISSSPYSLGSADRATTYAWVGALGTINLPDAASLGNNWFFNIRNAGTGDLTIDPAGADTINGALTLTLSPADSAVIVTDGTKWYTIGLGQQAVFAFDYTVISLAGLGGPSAVTTYTLSGSELNRISYKFTGAVLGDIKIVVPYTVQQYWVDNSTTGGSYALTMATSGGTPISISRNSRGIYYCNGTDVVKADTSAGIATPIGIVDGGTGATTALSAITNLGGTVVGRAVFTATSSATALLAIGGAASGANTDISALNYASGVSVGGDLTFTAAYSPSSVLSIGYRGVPQIGGGAKTANYTLVLTDAAGHVYFTGSTAAQTITIPADASVAYPIGTAISIVNNSSVTLSVAINADTLKLAGSGTTGTRTLSVGAVATALKVASTTWFISGAGVY